MSGRGLGQMSDIESGSNHSSKAILARVLTVSDRTIALAISLHAYYDLDQPETDNKVDFFSHDGIKHNR